MNLFISSTEELAIKKLPKDTVNFDTKTERSNTLNRLRNILALEIESLLKKNNLLKPPFELTKIKTLGQVKIEYEFLPRNQVGADGCLDTTPEGFVVKIDKELVEKPYNRFRYRSTIAHELGHTFFYDTTQLPPKKLGTEYTRKNFLLEEGLCYYLGREFLMPKFSISSLLATDCTRAVKSISNLEFFKTKYVVSSDIIGYRMITDLEIWDCIFIKFVEDGNLFRSKTKLKSKKSPIYKKMKIPKYVPIHKKSSEWVKKLSEHITLTIKNLQFQELISLDKHFIALDSKVEARNPISIVIIAYEEVD